MALLTSYNHFAGGKFENLGKVKRFIILLWPSVSIVMCKEGLLKERHLLLELPKSGGHVTKVLSPEFN